VIPVCANGIAWDVKDDTPGGKTDMGSVDRHLSDKRVQSRIELAQFARSIFGWRSSADRYGNEL